MSAGEVGRASPGCFGAVGDIGTSLTPHCPQLQWLPPRLSPGHFSESSSPNKEGTRHTSRLCICYARPPACCQGCLCPDSRHALLTVQWHLHEACSLPTIYLENSSCLHFHSLVSFTGCAPFHWLLIQSCVFYLSAHPRTLTVISQRAGNKPPGLPSPPSYHPCPQQIPPHFPA